jgi:hypothetical protein
MVEIKVIAVKLGEKEYSITEAAFRRSKVWKQRFMTEIKPLFKELEGVGDIAFNAPSDLLKLMPLAEKLFIEAIDTVLDLLVAYSPLLEEDREYIEDTATDKQIFSAFQEVIRLADFLGLTSQLNRQLGRATTGTLSNLQPPNGDAP